MGNHFIDSSKVGENEVKTHILQGQEEIEYKYYHMSWFQSEHIGGEPLHMGVGTEGGKG